MWCSFRLASQEFFRIEFIWIKGISRVGLGVLSDSDAISQVSIEESRKFDADASEAGTSAGSRARHLKHSDIAWAHNSNRNASVDRTTERPVVDEL